jgi:hypothetical protein
MRRKRSNQVPITLFSFQDIITSVTAILLLLTLLLAFELVQKAAMARATQPKQVAERVTESLQEIEAQLLELQSKLATQGKVASELAKSEKPEIQQQQDSANVEIAGLNSEIKRLEALKQDIAQEHARRKVELQLRDKDRKSLAGIREEQRRVQKDTDDLQKSNRRFFRVTPVSGKTPWLAEIAASRVLVAQLGSESTSRQFDGSALTGAGSAFVKWAGSLSPGSNYFVLAIRPSGVSEYRDVLQGLRERGFDVGFELLGEKDELLEKQPVKKS